MTCVLRRCFPRLVCNFTVILGVDVTFLDFFLRFQELIRCDLRLFLFWYDLLTDLLREILNSRMAFLFEISFTRCGFWLHLDDFRFVHFLRWSLKDRFDFLLYIFWSLSDDRYLCIKIQVLDAILAKLLKYLLLKLEFKVGQILSSVHFIQLSEMLSAMDIFIIPDQFFEWAMLYLSSSFLDFREYF
jgi:hypothetical protein